MNTPRVLPADVYDALELSALAFGGIGQPEVTDDNGCPVCMYGHAEALMDIDYDQHENEIVRVLNAAGLMSLDSDPAVERINARRGRDSHERVSFAAWCAELNVVRGR